MSDLIFVAVGFSISLEFVSLRLDQMQKRVSKAPKMLRFLRNPSFLEAYVFFGDESMEFP